MKDMKKKNNYNYTCSECKKIANLQTLILDSWTECESCKRFLCPEHFKIKKVQEYYSPIEQPQEYSLFCNYCRGKKEINKKVSRKERLKVENNCTVCDGLYSHHHNGIYNKERELAQVFDCQLCGKRICMKCRKNRKTGIHNIFCCDDCYKDERKVIAKTSPYDPHFEGEERGNKKSGNLLENIVDIWSERIKKIFE